MAPERERKPRARRRARVALTPIARNDEREFLRAVARSRSLHRPWVTPPTTKSAFRAFVERMQGPVNFGFLARSMASGEPAGFVEITNVVRGAFRSGYLGYYVFSGHERQGLMIEALHLAVRTAFSKLDLHRLEANIQPANEASIALVTSCGFVKEGYSSAYLKIRGHWRDHERWAIVSPR